MCPVIAQLGKKYGAHKKDDAIDPMVWSSNSIKIINAGYGFGRESKQLSDNGYHEVVRVTGKDGKVYIFDNNTPTGTELGTYMYNLAIQGAKGFSEGQAAFNLFKVKK
ncbi:hypothetical protein [uncultured Microscilla sp.]|uniref:hypothetical protein n=1 Tax=uncultured Microscilla sp. TaxID=432653 RepID=UPI00262F6BF7|nr:hypothetical protein [uncultured Microscilla sp.]